MSFIPADRIKDKEIAVPQICMKWPLTDTQYLAKNVYEPNRSVKITTKFSLMPEYTEPNGEKVTKLSIDLKLEGNSFHGQRQKEMELLAHTEAYDPVTLSSLHRSEGTWKFPKDEHQIKVMPILAQQVKIDQSSKDLDIRVDLRVLCYTDEWLVI